MPNKHTCSGDTESNKESTVSPDKLYSTQEVAKILGVSPDTLYCWKCNGTYDLPVKKVGRLNKYRHADIMDFLNSRTVNKYNNKEL
ncbi:MAG: excisionase [Alphaproteobacteria bacterium CG11_big_fil_rev_8_21_14_0_20_39_49]|nr:MAG: excisionase [Alphaproteobacteria bacterium CG11_big_fil_rev_8_21_14_0_20_39_49]